MDVTYKKDINHTYVVFDGGSIDTNNFRTQMLLHNMAEGLLHCTILRMDQKELWQCECTGMQSLEAYCKMHEIGKDDFVWIMNQILENIQELQDFLLDADNLYLMPGEIYIHPEKMKLLCCMVPTYSNDILESLKQILQFLLQYLSPEDSEVAKIVYGFFRTLAKDDCTLEDLWSHLYEKQRKWKLTGDQLKKENTFEKKKEAVSKKKESLQREEELDDRDALLEELFFNKKEETFDWKEKIQGQWATVGFIKKILYVFPALVAILLFLYLVFNSWTMSMTKLIIYAAIIVVLQIVSVIFYWKWGREETEKNPLFEDEESPGNSFLEEPEEGTMLLTESPKEEYSLVRMDNEKKYRINQREIIIGKQKENAQILLTEPVVSRIHAKVITRNNLIYIQDMNSKNGTYINGKRIGKEEVLLTYEDVLSIANIQFFLQK